MMNFNVDRQASFRTKRNSSTRQTYKGYRKRSRPSKQSPNDPHEQENDGIGTKEDPDSQNFNRNAKRRQLKNNSSGTSSSSSVTRNRNRNRNGTSHSAGLGLGLGLSNDDVHPVTPLDNLKLETDLTTSSNAQPLSVFKDLTRIEVALRLKTHKLLHNKNKKKAVQIPLHQFIDIVRESSTSSSLLTVRKSKSYDGSVCMEERMGAIFLTIGAPELLTLNRNTKKTTDNHNNSRSRSKKNGNDNSGPCVEIKSVLQDRLELLKTLYSKRWIQDIDTCREFQGYIQIIQSIKHEQTSNSSNGADGKMEVKEQKKDGIEHFINSEMTLEERVHARAQHNRTRTQRTSQTSSTSATSSTTTSATTNPQHKRNLVRFADALRLYAEHQKTTQMAKSTSNTSTNTSTSSTLPPVVISMREVWKSLSGTSTISTLGNNSSSSRGGAIMANQKSKKAVMNMVNELCHLVPEWIQVIHNNNSSNSNNNSKRQNSTSSIKYSKGSMIRLQQNISYQSIRDTLNGSTVGMGSSRRSMTPITTSSTKSSGNNVLPKKRGLSPIQKVKREIPFTRSVEKKENSTSKRSFSMGSMIDNDHNDDDDDDGGGGGGADHQSTEHETTPDISTESPTEQLQVTRRKKARIPLDAAEEKKEVDMNSSSSSNGSMNVNNKLDFSDNDEEESFKSSRSNNDWDETLPTSTSTTTPSSPKKRLRINHNLHLTGEDVNGGVIIEPSPMDCPRGMKRLFDLLNAGERI